MTRELTSAEEWVRILLCLPGENYSHLSFLNSEVHGAISQDQRVPRQKHNRENLCRCEVKVSHDSCDLGGKWDWRDSTVPECVCFCSCYCIVSLWQSLSSEWFKRKRCLSGSQFQKVQHTVPRSYCSRPVARPFVTVGEIEEAAHFTTSVKGQDLKNPFRGTPPSHDLNVLGYAPPPRVLRPANTADHKAC